MELLPAIDADYNEEAGVLESFSALDELLGTEAGNLEPLSANDAANGGETAATAEEVIDEWQFEEYEEYGLLYKEGSNALYFNGQLVRYFMDTLSGETRVKINADGVIDVYALRDGSGELIGVTMAKQSEFDARTDQWSQYTGIVVNSGENVSYNALTENEEPAVLDEINVSAGSMQPVGE